MNVTEYLLSVGGHLNVYYASVDRAVESRPWSPEEPYDDTPESFVRRYHHRNEGWHGDLPTPPPADLADYEAGDLWEHGFPSLLPEPGNRALEVLRGVLSDPVYIPTAQDVADLKRVSANGSTTIFGDKLAPLITAANAAADAGNTDPHRSVARVGTPPADTPEARDPRSTVQEAADHARSVLAAHGFQEHGGGDIARALRGLLAALGL